MLKRLFDWILDVDNCRSHPALLTSMTGEVLVRSSGGRGFYTTDIGLERLSISRSMFLGNNYDTCRKILLGDFDHCLTVGDKKSYIEEIKILVMKGGEYRDAEYYSAGKLHFPKKYWSKPELNHISGLLDSVAS